VSCGSLGPMRRRTNQANKLDDLPFSLSLVTASLLSGPFGLIVAYDRARGF